MYENLTRFEIAAIKKTASITKGSRAKVAKIESKIEALNNDKAALVAEIEAAESYIINKYGASPVDIIEALKSNNKNEDNLNNE